MLAPEWGAPPAYRLYVECAAGGVIFHPDRLTLEEGQATPAAIREQVARRQASRDPTAGRAYWLLLVLVTPT